MTEQAEILDWEVWTGETSWDLYLRARSDHGTFGLGYKIDPKNSGKPTIAIYFTESDQARSVNEHVTIVDGEITGFDHRVRRDDGLEYYHLKPHPKPSFIAEYLERIIETVPDDMAQLLLDGVSEDEWDKIRPENDESDIFKGIKGYDDITNVA